MYSFEEMCFIIDEVADKVSKLSEHPSHIMKHPVELIITFYIYIECAEDDIVFISVSKCKIYLEIEYNVHLIDKGNIAFLQPDQQLQKILNHFRIQGVQFVTYNVGIFFIRCFSK